MTARLVAQLVLVLVGVVTVVAPILQARSARRNLRADLTLNIQLLKELPAGSRERGELTAHVERQFESRLQHLDSKSQSSVDAAAVVFATIATAIGLGAIGLGGNWYFGLILTGLGLLLAAFADGDPTPAAKPDAEVRPRDVVREKLED